MHPRHLITALITASFFISFAQNKAIATVDFQKVPAKLYSPRDGLPNFFAKVASGKEVRVAYIGGSITEQNGWRPKTFKWFQEKYPKARFREISAGVQGTGSDLGVFRLQHDVLRQKPDLLFVEFAVNDWDASPEQIYKTMEGIVRKTWKADPTTDICFVYTIQQSMLKDYQNGTFPRSASAMEHVADHYGIPSISMAVQVAKLEKEGKLTFTGDPKDPAHAGKTVFSRDHCHPTDRGHELFREVIANAMEKMESVGTAGPHNLKKPFRKDNWEQAKMMPITKEMLTGSWREMRRDQGLGKSFAHRLPQLWLGSTPGDRLTFKYRGTQARLYMLIGPDAGLFSITIDGKPNPTPAPHFNEYCYYYRLVSVDLCKSQQPEEHTVSIEILKEQPNREIFLKHLRGRPGFTPERYNATNVWAGSLLILGDIVKP